MLAATIIHEVLKKDNKKKNAADTYRWCEIDQILEPIVRLHIDDSKRNKEDN